MDDKPTMDLDRDFTDVDMSMMVMMLENIDRISISAVK